MAGSTEPLPQPATATPREASEGWFAYIMQRVVVIFGFVAFAGTLARFTIEHLPASLEFWYNPYALLVAVPCVSIFASLILLSRVKRHSTMLTWLSLLLMTLGIWSWAEFMLRISATSETALVWAPVSTIGSAFIPVTLYMFTLAYTNSQRRQQPLLFLTMMTTSLLFLYVDLRTHLIDVFDPAAFSLKPWGYAVQTGSLYWVFAGWFMLLGFASLVQLFYFWRRTIDPAMRKQAKLIFFAVLLPLVIGGLTDALMPSLHLTAFPPLGASLTTFMGIVISYGILKYHYFNFAPDAIASQIMMTMNEAVIGVRPDFRISYVNSGAERLFGLRAEEFYTRNFTKFFSQEMRQSELKTMFHTLLSSKDFGTFDSVDLRTHDGQPITVKLSVTRVVDEGQPYGYLLVLTDITAIAQVTAMIERQVAEQTQEVRKTKTQLLNSINSLELGFIIIDQRPEVVVVNNVAHELFCGGHDHTAANCSQTTLDNIATNYIKDAPIINTIHKCYEKKTPQLIKSTVFRHRTWRIYISPMIDSNAVTGAAIVVQDITEEQILARSRDEFFSIASHELRTPLTAIKGNSSLMLQYYADDLKDPGLREMVDDIHESSDRLIMIVNDFLEVSRLEQGRVTYQLEEVSVSKIAEKIVYDLGATARQAKTHVKLGVGMRHHDEVPSVIADSGRLKQILYNLVGNAIKFTPNGVVTISAEVTSRQVRILVHDTGRGIASEMQPLLFHKFQQAGESILTRDASKGTGLGLYISRLLARGMDGDLVLVHSEPNGGSTFAVALPLATEARRKHLAPRQP